MASDEEHFTMAAPRLTPAPHLLLVTAPFYRGIADWMIEGAKTAIADAGATCDAIEVPGALEIPTAIRLVSRSHRYDGFVALGCVIRARPPITRRSATTAPARSPCWAWTEFASATAS